MINANNPVLDRRLGRRQVMLESRMCDFPAQVLGVFVIGHNHVRQGLHFLRARLLQSETAGLISVILAWSKIANMVASSSFVPAMASTPLRLITKMCSAFSENDFS